MTGEPFIFNEWRSFAKGFALLHCDWPIQKLSSPETYDLQEKKNTLMQEYSSTKSTMDELYQIRKNYGIYMGKEMER